MDFFSDVADHVAERIMKPSPAGQSDQSGLITIARRITIIVAHGSGRTPFDPHQDQMWRMVPGLADPAGGVSFQSVNLPDHYLRHNNYALRLDATFRVTP